MKAGTLFNLLASTECGDDVYLIFDDKKIEIDSLDDSSGGEFVLSAGQYTDIETEADGEA